MKTKEQIEAEFRADLKALLTKYKAEINLEDAGRYSYAACEEMVVSFDAEYDGNGNTLTEYGSFSLGRFECGE